MIKYLLLTFLFITNTYASDIVNITFLGTGTPRPDINKLGPSILIKTQLEEVLLDVGRGTTLRLSQAGNNYAKINDIYISHLHYDHIVGLADFWLTSNVWQKKTDTIIYGPIGIKNYCKGLVESYSEDIKYRYNNKKFSKLKCLNFPEKKIYKSNLTISSFKNSHGHIENSHGFKIEYAGRVIVYSGDTTYSNNVINNSKNIDILIHEVISTTKKIYNSNKKLRDVVRTHTNIDQLIKILNICKPKLTIINHALLFGVNENYVLTKIKEKYSGKVIFSKDLMSVDLGNEINIFNIGIK
ncbi:MAG: MBL fold metallo-hydrolase [Gammaproteobacteria bacterium]